MAYTDELKQLIKRVGETRPQRLAKKKEGWEFPMMSLAEKENRLRMFHPWRCSCAPLQESRVKRISSIQDSFRGSEADDETG